MGKLNLYVIQDNLKSLVWSHQGQSRKSKEDTPWEQVSLTFYPYADYEFVFEAISGSAYRSDIAIDDIVVSQNMCTLCEGDGLFDCQSSKSQLGLFKQNYSPSTATTLQNHCETLTLYINLIKPYILVLECG